MSRESKGWAAVGIAVAGFAAAVVAVGRTRSGGPTVSLTAIASADISLASPPSSHHATLRCATVPPSRDGDAIPGLGGVAPVRHSSEREADPPRETAEVDEWRRAEQQAIEWRDGVQRENLRRLEVTAAIGASDAAFALRGGWRILDAVRAGRVADPLRALDEARRALSAGLWLSEAEDPRWRATLTSAIAECNQAVYGATRTLPGVTEEVLVESGATPWRLIHRRSIGYAALLRWNGIEDLDPRRLRAGSRIRVPLEACWGVLRPARGTIEVWIGDAWVREFATWVDPHAAPIPPGIYEGGCLFEGPNPTRCPGDPWFDRARLPFWGRETGGLTLIGADDPALSAGLAGHGRLLLSKADSVELLAWFSYPGDYAHPGFVVLLR